MGVRALSLPFHLEWRANLSRSFPLFFNLIGASILHHQILQYGSLDYSPFLIHLLDIHKGPRSVISNVANNLADESR